MASDEVKALMNIPKKHTLRHYIALVGALYGENPDLIREYTEEQVLANENCLDQAIDCFKRLLPPGYEKEKNKEVIKKVKKIPGHEPKGSKLCPLGRRG